MTERKTWLKKVRWNRFFTMFVLSNPEDTMRNMGLIAVPGTVETEKTIVEIFENLLFVL